MPREMTGEERGLVEANLRLAQWLARRHRPEARLHRDDRESAAVAGLIEAAMMHRPGDGPFSHYASRAIRRRINDAIWEDRAVRLPQWLRKGGRRASTGDGPESIDLASVVAIDERPGPQEAAERADEEARLRRAMAGLDDRSRDVLNGFSVGDIDRDMAPALGLSRERVGEVRRAAIGRLRALMETGAR